MRISPACALPERELHKLATIIVRDDGTDDELCWGVSTTGNFSAESAYNLAEKEHSNQIGGTWTTVWKLKSATKS